MESKHKQIYQKYFPMELTMKKEVGIFIIRRRHQLRFLIVHVLLQRVGRRVSILESGLPTIVEL